MDNLRFSQNVGLVHDISQFSFIGEIEDYYYIKLNQTVDVVLVQNEETEGLLHFRICFDNTTSKLIHYDDVKSIVFQVFGVEPDEIYVNFAAHIVYLIQF